MKKIILNWCPPATPVSPSPPMSVLKKHLTNQGYNVEIIYWNLYLHRLQADFLWDSSSFENKETTSLLPFFNYYATKHNDSDARKVILSYIQTMKPQYINSSHDFYEKHIDSFFKKLDGLLNNYIDKTAYLLSLSYYFSIALLYEFN